MVSYPCLSEQQQRSLPGLKQAAKCIPAKFEDSTHQIWFCDTDEGEMVLKVCDGEVTSQSVFWAGVNALFESDFPASLGDIDYTHTFLTTHSPLSVPTYVASADSRFVLTQFLPGQDLDETSVTDALVVQLSEHIARLHQQQYSTWGRLKQPDLSAEKWPDKLHKTIEQLVEQHTIDDAILQAVFDQIKQLDVHTFVPLMLDLRWDQLRVLDNGDLALIDLDAFVVGPRELELVLMTYLLDKNQHDLFVKHYQCYLNYPDLSQCRLTYQVLLFLMNVLGESNLNDWLQHQH